MLRAVIFDCDGVIVDSEPHHLKAFKEVLAEEGISLSTEDYYSKYLAMDDKGCFEAVLHEHNRPVDNKILKSLIIRKMEIYRRLSQQELILYPGVVDLVRKLQGRYRLAIASGAFRGEVKFALDKGGMRDAFPVMVTAQDVRNGKPHPEAFQTALAQINAKNPVPSPAIRPDECLVIEDSLHGIEGAKAAGMKCLAVTNSYPKEKLTHADLVVKSLDQIRPDDLEKLF
ncbi:MAG: HAD family phosphatase [Nitrospirae bacterium]|nr:HAD family phosphatase [Nitrospirota bacterium]